MRVLALATLVSMTTLIACGNPSQPVVKAPAATSGATTLPPAPKVVKTSLSLAGIVVWTPSKVQVADGVATLTTHPGSGAFSGEIQLPEAVRKAGPGIVRIVTSTPTGGVVINATKLGDSNTALSERSVVVQADGEKTIEVHIADMSQPASILFANGSDKGSSTILLKSIEVEQTAS